MNIKLLVIAVFFLNAPSVNADPFGASDSAQIKILSKTYYEVKKMYETTMDQLKSLQAQQDTLVRMRDMYKAARDEQTFVENFELTRELNNVRRDISGLTLLDNDHSNKSSLEKLDVLAAELDRRLDDAKSPAERKYLEAQRSRVEQLKRLEKLREQKVKEAEDLVTKNPTEKTLAASNASSNALIAALMAAQRQKELELEIYREKMASENRQTVEGMANTFERIGKRKQQ